MFSPKNLIAAIAPSFPEAVFFRDIPEERKVIALTIDDVPARDEDSDTSTQKILDTIAHHNESVGTNAKATFFVITDHLNPNSTIVEKMVEGGHEIGNHGTTEHRHSSLSPEQFEQEFLTAHEELAKRVQPQSIRWFRPGQAFFNENMVSTLRTKGQALGYADQFALASMVPFDTRDFLDDPKFTLSNIKRFTFPGSILVLHGGSKEQAENTVEVLEKLLLILHEQGYEVVTLSELFNQ